jgi:hypothetical protein
MGEGQGLSEVQFQPFPKMARLTRECVITEKIDGTNAQVFIEHMDSGVFADRYPEPFFRNVVAHRRTPDDAQNTEVMFAGSRTRYITPENDNMGFAAWVRANAEDLFNLGPGRHFGEWWGSKIQRGYGRTYKTFSLFNTTRWKELPEEGPIPCVPGEGQLWAPACCSVVPELYRGLFSERIVENMLLKLKHGGSVAAPGYSQPEGIVIYHTAAGTMFKKLLENDDIPKSAVKAA